MAKPAETDHIEILRKYRLLVSILAVAIPVSFAFALEDLINHRYVMFTVGIFFFSFHLCRLFYPFKEKQYCHDKMDKQNCPVYVRLHYNDGLHTGRK